MRLQFGAWSLDTATRQVVRRHRPVHLSTKAFDFLALLVRRAPDVVSKHEIKAALWPATFVVEQNIPNLVAELRGALNDHADSPRFIRTVHGIGYAFVAGLCVRGGAELDRRFPALFWKSKQFLLTDGDNIAGKGAGVNAKIDHRAVSRRHARIVVQGRQALRNQVCFSNSVMIER